MNTEARMSKSLWMGLVLLLFLRADIAWAAPNKPPSVSLTSPANGASYAAPATITLTANASDPDGTVTKVEFYTGTTLIATKMSAPYTAAWANVMAGTYSLTAKAFDNQGLSKISSAVSVTVTGDDLVIFAPSNGAALYGGPTITGVVSGAYSGDPDTTAVLVDNGSSTRLATLTNNMFSTPLPLYHGANTITVTVARRDKTYTSKTLSVTGNGAPVLVVKAPNGSPSQFAAPADIAFDVEAISPQGTIERVEFVRNGTILGVATAPPYEFLWTDVPVGSYVISVRAFDDNGVSTVRSVSVQVVGPNSPPVVTLTGPLDGQTYEAPANVTMTATASDSDGSISLVEFLMNDAVVGTDSSYPYAITLGGVAAGMYEITARATDNRSATTTSAPARITVGAPNASPVVSITEPASGATYTAPAEIRIGAEASDSDGSIARVDFFHGATFIGTSTTPPYSVIWPSVLPGTYLLTAAATDNQGATSVSATVGVTVEEGPYNEAPTVALTSPEPGSSHFTPGAIVLRANASDADGSVVGVEFFANGTSVGTVTDPPYILEWTSPEVGSYALTARATDDRGAVTTSPVVNAIVTALSLSISSPINGATVAGSRVVVSGTISAPFNSGVMVNGYVAALDDDGQRFYVDLPLVAGSNTVTAILSTQNGGRVEREIVLYGEATASFLEIEAEEYEVIAPNPAKFRMANNSSTTATIQINGGSSSTLPAGGKAVWQVSFSLPGAHTVQFSASDESGKVTTQDFVMVIHDPARIDQKTVALWDGMNTALGAQDKGLALTYLSAAAKDVYGPAFDTLMPDYQQVASTFSSLERGSQAVDITEYLVRREFDARTFVFFIYFIRDGSGVWRLDGM